MPNNLFGLQSIHSQMEWGFRKTIPPGNVLTAESGSCKEQPSYQKKKKIKKSSSKVGKNVAECGKQNNSDKKHGQVRKDS